MNTSPFNIGIGDRILLGLLSPLVVLICVGAFAMVWHWEPEGLSMVVLRVVALEGTGTLVVLTTPVLVYAVAMPRWAEALMEQHMGKAMLFLFGVSLALVLACAAVAVGTRQ